MDVILHGFAILIIRMLFFFVMLRDRVFSALGSEVLVFANMHIICCFSVSRLSD